MPDSERYRPDPDNPRIRHLDGIPWDKAPLPRRFHRHRSQTQGWLTLIDFTRHCACGAIKQSGTRWTGRNSRRT